MDCDFLVDIAAINDWSLKNPVEIIGTIDKGVFFTKSY